MLANVYEVIEAEGKEIEYRNQEIINVKFTSGNWNEYLAGNKVELNKIYSFALMRFIIRIAQKNFTKKTLQKESSLVSIEENQEPPEDPRQIKFNF